MTARKTPRTAPAGLGDRGVALWESLGARFELAGPQGVLAHEACRLADRLEKLDQLLAGDVDTWAVLVHRTQTEDYELKIDAAAESSRRMQLALKQLLAAIGVEAAPAKSEQKPKGSPLDELSSRRTARGSGSPDPARSAGGKQRR